MAEIDNASDGTFNGPAADRELVSVAEGVVHMRLMVDEIVELGANRATEASFTEGLDVLNDVCDLAGA